VRKTSAVLATLSLAVLALTGCTAAPTFDGAACDRSGGSSGLADAVTVEGDLGAKPDVSIYTPLHVEKSAATDVVVGDGRVVQNGQQPFVYELTLFSGETGEEIDGTPYDPAQGPLTTLDIQGARFPALADALKCVTQGSRTVVALTADDAGAETLQAFGLDADDTMVFVVDTIDVLLPKAEGSLQFNDARGMPTVVRAPDGTPGVIIPNSDAPSSLVTQTLILGEGDDVEADQVPIVQYTALGWDDKTVMTQTWGKAVSTDLQQVAPAVAQELVGKPVGSQVLVVTPASDSAPAVVYVVDILGAITVPTP